MEIIFAILILTYALKNAVADVAYAVRGKTSPRLKLRAAQLEAAIANGGRVPVRYGAGDYFAGLWADAWSGYSARRESARTAPERLAWADRAGARGFAGRWWDEKWAEVEAKRARKKAEPLEQPRDEPEVLDELTDDDLMFGPASDEKPETPADPVPTEVPEDDTDAVVVPLFPPPRPVPDAVIPGEVPDELHDVDGDPPVPTTPDPKEKTMSETTTATVGEVVTLNDAIAWADSLAGGSNRSATAIESAIGDLRSQDVGEGALGKMAQLQELVTMTGQLAAQLATEFRGHTSVAEAYMATPDAGKKSHLIGG